LRGVVAAFIKPTGSAAGNYSTRRRACPSFATIRWPRSSVSIATRFRPFSGYCIRGRATSARYKDIARYCRPAMLQRAGRGARKLGLGVCRRAFTATCARASPPSSISSLQDLSTQLDLEYALYAGCLPTAGSPTGGTVLRPGRCCDAAASAAVKDATALTASCVGPTKAIADFHSVACYRKSCTRNCASIFGLADFSSRKCAFRKEFFVPREQQAAIPRSRICADGSISPRSLINSCPLRAPGCGTFSYYCEFRHHGRFMRRSRKATRSIRCCCGSATAIAIPLHRVPFNSTSRQSRAALVRGALAHRDTLYGASRFGRLLVTKGVRHRRVSTPTLIVNGIVVHNCLWVRELTRFVKHPFGDFAEFDWSNIAKVVKVFTARSTTWSEVNGAARRPRGDLRRPPRQASSARQRSRCCA